MKVSWSRFAWPGGLALLVLAGVALPLALAQRSYTFNEREVHSPASDVEKSDVWTLDFRFKDPRIIKVNIPGRGERICWYLWYQVINRTGKPRTFVPEFELVTKEYPAVYKDEILPCVEDAIRKREDPKGYQNIKNSVSIYEQQIPPSQADNVAFPRAVTGVAIWDGCSADPKKHDAKKKDLADASTFSIFVSGLSNYQVEVDPVRGKVEAPIVKRRTLQLNFKRLGDRYYMDSNEISFVPPAEWVDRASPIQVPSRQPKAAAK